MGTVEYDGAGAQTILADTYYNLELDGDGSGNKNAGGSVNVNGTFTVGANCARYRTQGHTTTITGATDINSELKVNNASGVFDANGSFDATGATIDFSADGVVKLSSTVVSLGNLDDAKGKIEYDGTNQNVLADAYYNLEIDGSGTKTSQGTVTIAGGFLVNVIENLRKKAKDYAFIQIKNQM